MPVSSFTTAINQRSGESERKRGLATTPFGHQAGRSPKLQRNALALHYSHVTHWRTWT
jgi:hypothetical protein